MARDKSTISKAQLLVLIVLLGLTGCNKRQEATSEEKAAFNPKEAMAKTNDFLKQYEVPSQQFTVSSAKPAEVRGKMGTVLHINANDLMAENGKPLGKTIAVELKEVMNQRQLLRTNAQTVSNGKLLVSGGAYYIEMTSDGNRLRLKDGKGLAVEFPKISSKEMQLFYGTRNSSGQMNWESANQQFENKSKQEVYEEEAYIEERSSRRGKFDSLVDYLENGDRQSTPKQKKIAKEYTNNAVMADNIYKTVSIKQLGWINCDQFYDNANNTNLKYVFNEKDSIVAANVYLVFKDINSVLQGEYLADGDNIYSPGFDNIPIGAKTQLIAISIHNGKTYGYKSDLTIKPNETFRITLNEISKAEIDKFFDVRK
jgi:hypothetical protein